eukprot:365306-Chlamydomonas_euryale.AAC.12
MGGDVCSGHGGHGGHSGHSGHGITVVTVVTVVDHRPSKQHQCIFRPRCIFKSRPMMHVHHEHPTALQAGGSASPSPRHTIRTLVSRSGPMNISYNLRLSAPNCVTTSSGLITLPRDLLILCARADTRTDASDLST